jgi:prephenate dehydratase
LPIVYGFNFSKNCIYDLINKNNINLLNGNDLIQIYNIKNLKKDINYCLNKKIKLVNISSRPIKLKYVAKNFFNIELNLYKNSRSMLMKTSILKKKKYFHSHAKTLQDLKNFLKNK